MKIILYANRNTGQLVLSYLVAKGHNVSVITEDQQIIDTAKYYNCNIIDFDTMGEFDLFICCHGKKIIEDKYLNNKFINIHPCLFKYKGHNPIKRYIKNKDTLGSVESQWLVKEIDGGDVIYRKDFETPICKTYAEFYNIAYKYYLECLDETLKRI